MKEAMTVEELREQLDEKVSSIAMPQIKPICIDYKVQGNQRQVWLYPRPVEISKGYHFKGDLVEILYAQNHIEKKLGVKPVLPEVDAVYETGSSEGAKDFRNLKQGISTYNDLMIAVKDEKLEVRKILGLDFKSKTDVTHPKIVLLNDRGNVLGNRKYSKEVAEIQIITSSQVLQREAVRYIGHFNYDRKGIIPTEKDLKEGGPLSWNGYCPDREGFAVVSSGWSSNFEHFDCCACGPLGDEERLWIFTEEPPRK